MRARNRPENDPEKIARVLLHYAALIAREQDSERLLALNAQMARDLVGAERCTIWLLDAEAAVLKTRLADGIDEIQIPLDQGIVGACARGGEPILVNDPSHDSRFFADVDKASEYRTKSLLSVPIRSAGGAVIGAFQALNKPGGFLGSDAELLTLASSYSAAVIDSQRLRRQAEVASVLCRELELARDVQQKMFPRDPCTPAGFDCAARCRAATFVGGDYYDLQLLPDGKFAITLGDVSGKGMSAALVMAQIQFGFRGMIRGLTGRLSQALADFNDVVCRSTTEAVYSTLFCAVLDPGTRELTYVNCGHIPPALISTTPGGVVQRLSAGGLPIGLLKGSRFEQETVTLSPGHVLVCCSDGFTDAENPEGKPWGEDSVIAAAMEGSRQNAEEITSHLFAEADRFTRGADQFDDMTAVVLRST